MDIAFFIAFGTVLLNMASAGVAAALALKVPALRLWKRVVLACLLVGGTGVLSITGIAVANEGTSGDPAALVAIVLAFLGIVAGIAALPGAIVVGRMAERVPPVGDTFA